MKTYPVDIQASVAQVNRNGIIKDFNSYSICNLMKNDTFSFSIGSGNIYILFVDDRWYWMHESSAPLCKKMAQYENARRAYCSDMVELLTEFQQGQYDKVQTAKLREELIARHEKLQLAAIEQFMDIEITLPPVPIQPLEDDVSTQRNARGLAQYKHKRPRSTRHTYDEADRMDTDIFWYRHAILFKNRFEEYAEKRLLPKSTWASSEERQRTKKNDNGISITGKPHRKKFSLTK